MSELEARKYTSIRNLREEIRQDMEDYKLFCFVEERIANQDWMSESIERQAYEFKHDLLDLIFNNIEKFHEQIEQEE
jgi:hypothetical protein